MNVFELFAKLTLDDKEYREKLSGAGTTLKKFGQSAGKIALAGAKAIGTGIAVGAAGVAALTKSAVESYAQYEQLVGGVETLFDQSADKVLTYANEAYKSAGLSANEYMETVTSFSASLLQSLGGDTEKAADYADMAIRDMSDNANKMGTDMSAIQTAYQGFAKQNYTMLDNLKLGYGGTKTEMERLVEDAEKLDGSFKAQRDSSGKLTLSYADVVDAIHIVQTQMGITGTTAKEASTTIEGSVNSMKSAWKNLVTGLADDNADIEKLIDNLVETIIGKNGNGGVVNNILPAVRRALNGIVKVITEVAPKITPIIVDVIIENLPMLIEAGTQVLVALITGIIQALPQLIAALPAIFEAIKTAFVENWPALKEAGVELLHMIGEGILSAVDWLKENISEIVGKIKDFLVEKWGQIKEDAAQKWSEIKEDLSTKWNDIKSKAEETWNNIKDFASRKNDEMKIMLKGKWDNIKQAYDEHGGGLRGIAEATMQGIKEYFTFGFDAVNTLTGGKLDALKEKISNIFQDIKEGISSKLETIKGLFDFEWSFPHIKLPHFSWDWMDIGGLVSIPRISVDWYKKAYDQPYMFTKPTLAGFGDGNGGEMVYGKDNLMKDIRDAVSSVNTSEIVINVYPQKGQSEEEIAQKVERVLVRWDRQRKAAGLA